MRTKYELRSYWVDHHWRNRIIYFRFKEYYFLDSLEKQLSSFDHTMSKPFMKQALENKYGSGFKLMALMAKHNVVKELPVILYKGVHHEK